MPFDGSTARSNCCPITHLALAESPSAVKAMIKPTVEVAFMMNLLMPMPNVSNFEKENRTKDIWAAFKYTHGVLICITCHCASISILT